MKNLVKSVIGAVAPSVLKEIKRRRAAAHSAKLSQRLTPVADELLGRIGTTVRAGPFAGMKYIRESTGSALAPKILGFYERELATVVSDLLAHRYEIVLDVGCAEGYYAVGFAFASPETRVIAFDIDAKAQSLCKALVRENSLESRVDVRGECTHGELQTELAGRRGLVICDCEGFESVLLDPAKAPALRTTDLLVELHEFAVPGVTETVLARFRDTHTALRIPAVAIDSSTVPELSHLGTWERDALASEWRPPNMEWAVLRVKS